MHTLTSTRTWHHANDNGTDIPFEPPSFTPAAAPKILPTNTNHDVALTKDVAPVHEFGFTVTGAWNRAQTGILHFSTYPFVRRADPLIRIPANDS